MFMVKHIIPSFNTVCGIGQKGCPRSKHTMLGVKKLRRHNEASRLPTHRKAEGTVILSK